MKNAGFFNLVNRIFLPSDADGEEGGRQIYMRSLRHDVVAPVLLRPSFGSRRIQILFGGDIEALRGGPRMRHGTYSLAARTQSDAAFFAHAQGGVEIGFNYSLQPLRLPRAKNQLQFGNKERRCGAQRTDRPTGLAFSSPLSPLSVSPFRVQWRKERERLGAGGTFTF